MSYSTVFNSACWAALICFSLGEIQSAQNVVALAAAREEACVVVMGNKLAELEARVEDYLAVYERTLVPLLGAAEAQ